MTLHIDSDIIVKSYVLSSSFSVAGWFQLYAKVPPQKRLTRDLRQATVWILIISYSMHNLMIQC